MENVSKPSFICFTTELKKEDGEGSASMIVRLEDLELDNQQLSAPMIKCKKRPRKKCSFVAEVKGKR